MPRAGGCGLDGCGVGVFKDVHNTATMAPPVVMTSKFGAIIKDVTDEKETKLDNPNPGTPQATAPPTADTRDDEEPPYTYLNVDFVTFFDTYPVIDNEEGKKVGFKMFDENGIVYICTGTEGNIIKFQMFSNTPHVGQPNLANILSYIPKVGNDNNIIIRMIAGRGRLFPYVVFSVLFLCSIRFLIDNQLQSLQKTMEKYNGYNDVYEALLKAATDSNSATYKIKEDLTERLKAMGRIDQDSIDQCNQANCTALEGLKGLKYEIFQISETFDFTNTTDEYKFYENPWGVKKSVDLLEMFDSKQTLIGKIFNILDENLQLLKEKSALTLWNWLFDSRDFNTSFKLFIKKNTSAEWFVDNILAYVHLYVTLRAVCMGSYTVTEYYTPESQKKLRRLLENSVKDFATLTEDEQRNILDKLENELTPRQKDDLKEKGYNRKKEKGKQYSETYKRAYKVVRDNHGE